jgi:hypothetical protein
VNPLSAHMADAVDRLVERANDRYVEAKADTHDEDHWLHVLLLGLGVRALIGIESHLARQNHLGERTWTN